uniref:Zinc finger piccolo-type domain-containing protein n=1 Tax=Echeneis naucrates TaxID=173247 RepID=A0A665V4J0_ECHNA
MKRAASASEPSQHPTVKSQASPGKVASPAPAHLKDSSKQAAPQKNESPGPAIQKKDAPEPASPQKKQPASATAPLKKGTGPEKPSNQASQAGRRQSNAAITQQESAGFFGFGAPKSQPDAAKPAESVGGKMFGFGSSLFSSASTMISSAVQDQPKTTPPISPKMSPAKEIKPTAVQKKEDQKKPEHPQQAKTPPSIQAKVDKAPSEPPKAAPAPQESVKPGQSTCLLCKAELNIGSKDKPNYNTCTECKNTVCNQCGFNPMPNETGVKQWLCLTCQMQRALGATQPSGIASVNSQILPKPDQKDIISPTEQEKKASTDSHAPQRKPSVTEPPAKAEATKTIQGQKQASPIPSPKTLQEPQKTSSLTKSVELKSQNERKHSNAAAAPQQESAGLFNFGGPKTQPDAAKPAESVGGKMFGFGSSLFSSASTMISSAVQDQPKTTPPISPKMSPAKEIKPTTVQKKEDQKKPEHPQQAKTPPSIQAKVDKAPSEPPKAAPAPQESVKPGQSTSEQTEMDKGLSQPEKPEATKTSIKGVQSCPLCKAELNVGSKDLPNYNTCTECKTKVCNKCGFSPMPNVTEKEWLCLNCQTQRALLGQLGDSGKKPQPSPVSARPETQATPASPKAQPTSASQPDLAKVIAEADTAAASGVPLTEGTVEPTPTIAAEEAPTGVLPETELELFATERILKEVQPHDHIEVTATTVLEKEEGQPKTQEAQLLLETEQVMEADSTDVLTPTPSPKVHRRRLEVTNISSSSEDIKTESAGSSAEDEEFIRKQIMGMGDEEEMSLSEDEKEKNLAHEEAIKTEIELDNDSVAAKSLYELGSIDNEKSQVGEKDLPKTVPVTSQDVPETMLSTPTKKAMPVMRNRQSTDEEIESITESLSKGSSSVQASSFTPGSSPTSVSSLEEDSDSSPSHRKVSGDRQHRKGKHRQPTQPLPTIEDSSEDEKTTGREKSGKDKDELRGHGQPLSPTGDTSSTEDLKQVTVMDEPSRTSGSEYSGSIESESEARRDVRIGDKPSPTVIPYTPSDLFKEPDPMTKSLKSAEEAYEEIIQKTKAIPGESPDIEPLYGGMAIEDYLYESLVEEPEIKVTVSFVRPMVPQDPALRKALFPIPDLKITQCSSGEEEDDSLADEYGIGISSDITPSDDSETKEDRTISPTLSETIDIEPISVVCEIPEPKPIPTPISAPELTTTPSSISPVSPPTSPATPDSSLASNATSFSFQARTPLSSDSTPLSTPTPPTTFVTQLSPEVLPSSAATVGALASSDGSVSHPTTTTVIVTIPDVVSDPSKVQTTAVAQVKPCRAESSIGAVEEMPALPVVVQMPDLVSSPSQVPIEAPAIIQVSAPAAAPAIVSAQHTPLVAATPSTVSLPASTDVVSTSVTLASCPGPVIVQMPDLVSTTSPISAQTSLLVSALVTTPAQAQAKVVHSVPVQRAHTQMTPVVVSVQRTTVSVVHERLPQVPPPSVAITIQPDVAKVQPLPKQNGKIIYPGDVIDLRTMKVGLRMTEKGMDLTPPESCRQSFSSDSSRRQITAVQPEIVNLSAEITPATTLSVVTDSITIVTCAATIASYNNTPAEKPLDLQGPVTSLPLPLTTCKPFEPLAQIVYRPVNSQPMVSAVGSTAQDIPINLSFGALVSPVTQPSTAISNGCPVLSLEATGAMDLSNYRPVRAMVALSGTSPGVVTTVVEDDGTPVDLTAGRRSVCCDIIYKLPFTGSCRTQPPVTSQPQNRFGYRDDHYQYDNAGIYGIKGMNGIKASMSETNLTEAGLFPYDPKNDYDYFSGSSDGAIDLTASKFSAGEYRIIFVCFCTASLPLRLVFIKYLIIFSFKFSLPKELLPTALADIITGYPDMYSDTTLEAIAASLDALASSPIFPGLDNTKMAQYQMEREFLELEKLKQLCLAEELEWERQEIQRYREQEQLMVQRELEELQALKQQLLLQQEEEHHAHMVAQQETYAQQKEQLQQIQQLQLQLQRQLDEHYGGTGTTGNLLDAKYAGVGDSGQYWPVKDESTTPSTGTQLEEGHEQLSLVKKIQPDQDKGKKIIDSGVQTDDEDSAEKQHVGRRKKTKRNVDTSAQTDDEDQDEWDAPTKARRRSRKHSSEGKHGSKVSSIAIQTVAEISVQTDHSGTIKRPNIQMDTKVEIIKHISAPENSHRGGSLSCQTDSDRRHPPIEVGYSTHLTADVPAKSKGFYTAVSPLSPEKSLGGQRMLTADPSRFSSGPRIFKAGQKSLSDTKSLSPTTEDRMVGYNTDIIGSSNLSSPSGTGKKVKRTLPDPPPEDDSLMGRSGYSTNSARRRLARSTTMARAKILQDIDKELDLVERESSKLRKKQAELDEEEKEIDAKLRYLEMGINRRKEALLKEREKRERAYLQGVAEERDYMSDSEVSNIREARGDGLERPRTAPQSEFDQFIPPQTEADSQYNTLTSPYSHYAQYVPQTQTTSHYTQQNLYQQQSLYHQQVSPYPTLSLPHAQAQPNSYQHALLLQQGKQRQTTLSDLEPKITTNYEVIRNQPLLIVPTSTESGYGVAHLGGKYGNLDLRLGLEERSMASSPMSSISADSFYADIDHHNARNYVLIEDIGELTKASTGLSNTSSSRLQSYGKGEDDTMEEPYELKLLKQQIKQEFRRGTEGLEHLTGLGLPQYLPTDGSFRHFPKGEKYSIGRLTLEKQAAKQLPAAVLYQKQMKNKKALIDPKAITKFSPIQESKDLEPDFGSFMGSGASSVTNLAARARLLQDEITFGLRKNLSEQQKYLGSSLGSLGLVYGLDLSIKRDLSSSSLRLKTEGEVLDAAFAPGVARAKPTSLPISQSRGRIPIVAQNSEEESPLSPVGQPMGMARASAGPLPPISADSRDQFGSSHSLPEVQQHMREESRTRGYDRDIAFIMDDLQGAMSDSEGKWSLRLFHQLDCVDLLNSLQRKVNGKTALPNNGLWIYFSVLQVQSRCFLCLGFL